MRLKRHRTIVRFASPERRSRWLRGALLLVLLGAGVSEPQRGLAQTAQSASAWLAELPPVSGVRSKLKRHEGPTTAEYQEAAFVVLVRYIEARSRDPITLNPLPFDPAVAARKKEYQQALSGAKVQTDRGTDFDIEILSKFVSPRELAIYKSSGFYQVRQSNEQADARTAQAAKEAADLSASMASEAAELSASMAAEAAKARVDLGVFGITLYKPLNLPACPQGERQSFGG